MQDEMRIHLELYQADLRRRGLPEAEARRRAFADFGSLLARKEECREAVGLRLFDELRGDVVYAVQPPLRVTKSSTEARVAGFK